MWRSRTRTASCPPLRAPTDARRPRCSGALPAHQSRLPHRGEDGLRDARERGAGHSVRLRLARRLHRRPREGRVACGGPRHGREDRLRGRRRRAHRSLAHRGFDLARVKGDPLLGKLRTFLRKEYGFPAGSADGRSTLFGIPAVYSTEPLRQPGADSLEAIGAEPGSRIGFGSFVSVTGSAGLRLAGIVINDIAGAQNTAD